LIIKFLGTGTSQGIPVVGCECETCISENHKDKRLRSSIYLDVEGTKIIIDTGPDLRQQLLQNNINDVDAILITHEHNDHTAGLDDIRPINFKHNKKLPLFAIGRVITDIRKRFEYVFNTNPYPGSPKIDLQEISPYQSFIINNISILPIEIDHGSLKIVGYRIRNFAYLTDVSNLDDKALSFLKNLDVLVISTLHRDKHHSHLSFEESINYSKIISAKKTYFIHMSHTLGLQDDWSKELPYDIEGAFDGLELSLAE
jgi:phosphoribosyl 1,2-cyclic phosphate phosphodiesterase